MNNNLTENNVGQSVIAIAKTDTMLKAVELRKQNGAAEVLWTRSSKEGDMDWQAFAAECGLSTESTIQSQTPSNKNVVVGYDSTGTAFYQVSIPAVEEKEIAAIVQLQAESRLPLPSNQMELAWRVNRTQDEQINITMAAVRKQQVNGFIQKVLSFKPGKILLDCEGIVQTWRITFSGDEQNAVIINAGLHNTQVCLVENGKLCNAVALDTGIEDFSKREAEEETETTERFIQDMRSVVDLFGSKQSEELPVIVLSDGGEMYISLVSALRSAGLNARLGSPDLKYLKPKKKLKAEDIFEYRLPIGLALMTLDADYDELNLFERMYKPDGGEEKKHWLYSPKITGAIAAAMLFLTILVFLVADIAKPGVIEGNFEKSGAEIDINALINRQTLLKTIAQERPDLLALLSDITKSGQSNEGGARGLMGMGSGGIQLDSFHFKKGQRVSITGQVSGNEQLYSFEDNLENLKDISEVETSTSPNTRSATSTRGGTNPRGSTNTRGGTNTRSPVGPGGGGLKFNITFKYKNFTSK